jgi:DNA processing protein
LPQLAIVGSRHPTPDGRRNARAFAAHLCRAGYQITSGLALGIDGEAHVGALESQGVTIAVLGSGLNHIHPRQHKGLAARIAERGAVISEFPLDEPGRQSHFPRRNRIISGLAHGVLVIEAAEQSGSLITARLAGEQGRAVFALPGSIHNPLARGCHRLLRQGAKMVESVADIFEELPALLAWERQQDSPSAARKAPLDVAARRVLDQVGYDPVSVDALLQRTGGEPGSLQATLIALELSGYVVNQGGTWVRTGTQGL